MKSMVSFPADWDLETMLAMCVSEYNNRAHSTTKMPPFEVLYSKDFSVIERVIYNTMKTRAYRNVGPVLPSDQRVLILDNVGLQDSGAVLKSIIRKKGQPTIPATVEGKTYFPHIK